MLPLIRTRLDIVLLLLYGFNKKWVRLITSDKNDAKIMFVDIFCIINSSFISHHSWLMRMKYSIKRCHTSYCLVWFATAFRELITWQKPHTSGIKIQPLIFSATLCILCYFLISPFPSLPSSVNQWRISKNKVTSFCLETGKDQDQNV